MTTCWGISVSIDGTVKVSTGDTTLEKTLERGIQDASYYQAIYPEAKITLHAEEQCPMCWGRGYLIRTVKSAIGAKTVRCPNCKGKVPTNTLGNTLGPITYRLSDDSSKIRLVQTA